MKIIVSALLMTLTTLQVCGQDFSQGEFIVQYIPNATASNKQVVRDLYGITNYSIVDINDRIELWEDINFPIIYSENGQTTYIDNIEGLLFHINIQNGDQGNTTARSNVQHGDLQMFLSLEEDDTLYPSSTFDPLPFCDDSHNNRLIGPDQSMIPNQEAIKIIIADQYIPEMTSINLFDDPSILGGSHGRKVYSIMDNLLTQAGITDVEFLNLVAFDNTGHGKSEILVKIADFLDHQFESGAWSLEDKVIVNFSANLITSGGGLVESSKILKQEWAEIFGSSTGNHVYIPYENVALISAAGNQGFNSGNNVFPGEVALATEISVAGTEQCFTSPWENSNSSQDYFEIATEAVDVLTYDGTYHYLSNGTSFATPQVTAAMVQIALDSPDLSLIEVKNKLLVSADNVSALSTTVENGQVLNIENYFSSLEEHRGSKRIESITQPLTKLSLQTSPNPFSQVCMLTIDVPIGISAQVSLYNSVGQLVAEEHIPNQQELTVLEWYTPQNLPAGTYFLQVQAGEAIQQQMIIKQ